MSTINSKIFRTGLVNELTILQFIKKYTERILNDLKTEQNCSFPDASFILHQVLNTLKLHFGEKNTFSEKKLWKVVNDYVDKELQMLQNAKHKNFGLSEASFNELLVALQQGDNTLYERTFLTHFKDCIAYLKHRYQASHQDAYDTTMDTMLEFCYRLKEGKIKYGNLRFLFTQMASQIYLKWVKKQQAMDPIEGIHLPNEKPEDYDDEVYRKLDKAWDQLCADCQQLLKGFYYGKMSLREMAKESGKSDVALRKRKQRCVDKLRVHFKKFYQ